MKIPSVGHDMRMNGNAQTIYGALEDYADALTSASWAYSNSIFNASRVRDTSLVNAENTYTNATFNAQKTATLSYYDAAISELTQTIDLESKQKADEAKHCDSLATTQAEIIDNLFEDLEEIAPDDDDGITSWLGSLQTSGSAIGTVATTEQSARSGRNSNNTTVLTNLKTVLAAERSAAAAAADRLYRNTEQSAWNTYLTSVQSANTTYLGSIKTSENTYKTASDAADTAYRAASVTAYTSFQETVKTLDIAFYAAVSDATDPTFTTTTYFNTVGANPTLPYQKARFSDDLQKDRLTPQDIIELYQCIWGENDELLAGYLRGHNEIVVDDPAWYETWLPFMNDWAGGAKSRPDLVSNDIYRIRIDSEMDEIQAVLSLREGLIKAAYTAYPLYESGFFSDEFMGPETRKKQLEVLSKQLATFAEYVKLSASVSSDVADIILTLHDAANGGELKNVAFAAIPFVPGSMGKSCLPWVTSSGAHLIATPGKTTTVLGRFKSDMGKIIEHLQVPKSKYVTAGNEGGFNVLNVPDALFKKSEKLPGGFWAIYNRRFLRAAVTRGDVFVMATPIKVAAMFTNKDKWKNFNLFDVNAVKKLPVSELTTYGREYQYLLIRGYRYDFSTKQMIPGS